MKKLINLTPHQLTIVSWDGSKTKLEPSGQVARVAVGQRLVRGTEEVDMTSSVGDVELPDIHVQEVGEVQGLPNPDGETLWVVSTLVRQAVPHRTDVASPGELLRDDAGQPIGCRGLVVNQGTPWVITK